MYIIQQLKTLGLNNSEIKIYMFLLENGISTPPGIAKATGIQRTNTYNVLTGLETKGLIHRQIKSNNKVYLARDPEALVYNLERKKEVAQQLLPDLRALYTI